MADTVQATNPDYPTIHTNGKNTSSRKLSLRKITNNWKEVKEERKADPAEITNKKNKEQDSTITLSYTKRKVFRKPEMAWNNKTVSRQAPYYTMRVCNDYKHWPAPTRSVRKDVYYLTPSHFAPPILLYRQ